MIFGAACLTLDHVLHVANRNDRDDEEKRDEAHSLFLIEITDCAAVTTAHLRRHWF